MQVGNAIEEMDQFKKIYRPVLKTIKPGEKKASGDVSRFDFSRQFAAMMKRGEVVASTNEPPSGEVEASPSEPPSASTLKEPAPPFEFEPKLTCKLNLNRPGLLKGPSTEPSDGVTQPQELPMDEPKPSSTLDLDSEELIEPMELTKQPSTLELQKPENAPLHSHSPPPESVFISTTVLDESIIGCRSKLNEIEEELYKLETTLPATLSQLDERIGNQMTILLSDPYSYVT